MTIAIKVNLAERARQLKAQNSFLSDADIAALAGMPLKNVKNALQRRPKGDRPKSRVR